MTEIAGLGATFPLLVLTNMDQLDARSPTVDVDDCSKEMNMGEVGNLWLKAH